MTGSVLDSRGSRGVGLVGVGRVMIRTSTHLKDLFTPLEEERGRW